MRVLLILLVTLVSTRTLAASNKKDECKHDTATAKSLLSAVYTAEKAHHAEKNYFSGEFADIGFDPNIHDDDSCDKGNWDVEVTAVTPNEFTATAFSRVDGEEYTINEKKEVLKAGEVKRTPAMQVTSAPTDEAGE